LTFPPSDYSEELSAFGDQDGKDKVLIINRSGANEDIKADYASDTLQYPISWTIPNEYQNVVTSINRGIPLMTLAPASNITKSIENIVKGINRTFYPEGVREEEKRSLLKKFFSKD
jgi:MinD-like ATPase involved in chromosome partitioning or flagellar assembly